MLALQILVASGAMILYWINVYLNQELIIILLLLGAAGIMSGLILGSHGERSRSSAKMSTKQATSWPTLTIAIPARNETEDLEQCLDSVLASDYPKLEILVLDDCSQSPRTPEIIRSFAHDGVRFIQGQEPNSTWLAKNQAYATLAKEASGDYIAFMGVDIRLQAGALRQLMANALAGDKHMLSVLPHNIQTDKAPVLIQPMRYFWELGLPRKLMRRPPVLSSFWLVDRHQLIKAGGFGAVSRKIVPEAFFAREFAGRDQYSFLVGGQTFGVISIKSRTEQYQTAVRVSYPQLHRRPEMVCIVSLIVLLGLLTPPVTIWAGFTTSHASPVVAGLAVSLLWLWVYARLLTITYGRATIANVLGAPLAILTYLMILHISLYKYEFSEVLWKGRNVCIPVMHVTPHLPKV